MRVPALLVLRNGSTVNGRWPPEMKRLSPRGLRGLGPETRYARFLAGVSRLNDRTRSELARVDHRDREALTAVAALRHGANRRTRVAGIGSAAYRKGTARGVP